MRLEVIQNTFPADFAWKLYEFCRDSKFIYGWKSTTEVDVPGHWNCSYVEASASNGLDVSDKLPDIMKEAWEHVQKRYPEMILLRCYTNLHTYGCEGYPHRDSARDSDFTLVVYMTPDWKISWAGETQIFKDGDIYFSQIPRFNTGIFFPGAEVHVARGVTRICQAPRMTLMFKMNIRGSDVVRDNHQRYLETIGAYEKNHTGRTLADHLLNTYDGLKYAKCAQSVCLAGGSHSLLGTNAFKQVSLDTPEKVQELKDKIGQYAFELVQYFSTIKRPDVLENGIEAYQAGANSFDLELEAGGTVTVGRNVFYDLLCMEAVNLHDQHALNRFPNLREFWKDKGIVKPK